MEKNIILKCILVVVLLVAGLSITLMRWKPKKKNDHEIIIYSEANFKGNKRVFKVGAPLLSMSDQQIIARSFQIHGNNTWLSFTAIKNRSTSRLPIWVASSERNNMLLSKIFTTSVNDIGCDIKITGLMIYQH